MPPPRLAGRWFVRSYAVFLSRQTVFRERALDGFFSGFESGPEGHCFGVVDIVEVGELTAEHSLVEPVAEEHMCVRRYFFNTVMIAQDKIHIHVIFPFVALTDCKSFHCGEGEECRETDDALETLGVIDIERVVKESELNGIQHKRKFALFVHDYLVDAPRLLY